MRYTFGKQTVRELTEERSLLLRKITQLENSDYRNRERTKSNCSGDQMPRDILGARKAKASKSRTAIERINERVRKGDKRTAQFA